MTRPRSFSSPRHLLSPLTSVEMAEVQKPHVKIGLWDYVDDVPPPFGRPMHEFWSFEPRFINLNHGAFGAPPTPVQRSANVIADLVEESPDKFFRLDMVPLLASVRERLAAFIGAEKEEVVLVPNATSAAGIVLRNFDWKTGDVLVGASTTYGNVAKTILHLKDTNPELTVAPFGLQFPVSNAAIIDAFRAHLRSIPRVAASAANPDPKIVCVVDSIVSNPGIYMPWKEMVKICKDEGVWSVVDAAHSIGQEPGLNMAEVQPDFWFSNCHKWLYAKRSSAVLYVPRRNQHIIKSAFPTSHLYASPGQPLPADWIQRDANGDEWAAQFSWTGTLDLSPYLSIDAALDFRKWLGGEEVINSYCRDLALQGGKRVAEIMGTRLMDESEGNVQTLNMVNVELPLNVPSDKAAYVTEVLTKRLLLDHKAYAAHFLHNGKYWTRLSAQLYNELADFEKMAEAFVLVCKEI